MFGRHDVEVLRPLAAQLREIGESAEMERRRALWRRTNDLLPVEAPPILVYPEGSWSEIDATLPVECRDTVAREFEHAMRRNLFVAAFLGDDSVINPYFETPHFTYDSGWGVELAHRRSGDARGSWTVDPALRDLPRDLARLRPREVTYEGEKTERYFEAATEAFGDLLPVILRSDFFWSLGMTGTVIDMVGLQEFMMLMIDAPRVVHRLMDFMMREHREYVRQLEELGIVTCNSECWHIGSGGLGFNSTLPGIREPGHATCRDCWGLLESQETVGVSPQMFGEFIWPYQEALAPCFGWVYYGCCEPVESRFEWIRRLPNLRGISVSPWSDVARCAQLYGRRYVMFCKPNPAHVAAQFLEDAVTADLDRILVATRDNSIAVILKDLHTVRHDLGRYRRWSALARRAIERHRGG